MHSSKWLIKWHGWSALCPVCTGLADGVQASRQKDLRYSRIPVVCGLGRIHAFCNWSTWRKFSRGVCVCVFYISSFPRFFKFAFQICVMIILECCERQLNNILVWHPCGKKTLLNSRLYFFDIPSIVEVQGIAEKFNAGMNPLCGPQHLVVHCTFFCRHGTAAIMSYCMSIQQPEDLVVDGGWNPRVQLARWFCWKLYPFSPDLWLFDPLSWWSDWLRWSLKSIWSKCLKWKWANSDESSWARKKPS